MHTFRTAFCVLFCVATFARAQTGEPENLALAATASASEDFGPTLVAALANDGNPSTRWSGISGHNAGVWFELDWPAPVTMREVVLQQYDTYVKELDLQSWDASANAWRTIEHFGDPNSKLALVVVADFDAVTTSKLRVGNITNGPSFTEVEVYERPMPPTTVLGSDVDGHILGMVCDHWGRAPIAGAKVDLAASCASGAWSESAVADEHGLFAVAMPLGLKAAISLRTAHGGASEASLFLASHLQYGLTPTSFGEPLQVLDRGWKFAPDPPGGIGAPSDFTAPNFDDRAWAPIDVPSHWEMKGFRASTGVGGYRLRFDAPKGAGRVKLRFDGVYSGAEVFVNGALIAYHEGGALPFEVDVTDQLSPSGNLLALRVSEHTRTSDSLDAMSQYADFALGGIFRKVTLLCVPEVHIGAIESSTKFDAAYRDATVHCKVAVLAEGGSAVAAGALRFALCELDGQEVAHAEAKFAVQAWQRGEIELDLPVASPKKWNAESPNLYLAKYELRDGARSLQTVTQRFGFRQTEVRGSEILIDGSPVKIRGTCHHDSHPLMGRAVTPELAAQDLALIKEANLNAIRTSHYAPLPETIDFADELGVYVEDEGSFCWTNATDDLRLTPRVMQLNCELVARDRNHPSVFIWSISNESRIGYGLWRSREWIQKADRSRPTTGTYHNDGDLDVAVRHNPITEAEITEVEHKVKVPLIWDECWCIWQNIWGDAGELWIDPGIRDYYITHQQKLFEHFIHSPVVQGTQIWCWSDDVFLLPGAGLEYGRGDTPVRHSVEQYSMEGRGVVGDGEWGVVDGWRRKKPEFWHIAKLHSPIVVREGPLELPSSSSIAIPAENRYDFTDLSELRVDWQLAAAGRVDSLSGGRFVPPRVVTVRGIGKASGRPHALGSISIDLGKQPSSGDVLALDIVDRRGVTVDRYRLPFGASPIEKLELASIEAKPLSISSEGRLNGGTTTIRGNGFELAFGDTFGTLRRGVGFGRELLRSAPRLHVAVTEAPDHPLPALDTWHLEGFETKRDHDDVVVEVRGSYDQFRGSYVYRIQPDGEIFASASFEFNGGELWARELGLEFEVPRDAEFLRWVRDAEYSVYPDDHIGRGSGETFAFRPHSQTLPPTWNWSSDATPQGCNDFRSTKRAIREAWIGYPERGAGVAIESDGTQNLRAAVEGDRIAVYVNSLYDGIGGRYEWTANYGRGRHLAKGDKLEVRAHLRLTPAPRVVHPH